MIVTFHLAVYFMYYVWNTYLSHNNPDNQSNQNNSGSSNSGNSNQTNAAHVNEVDRRPRPNQAQDAPTNAELKGTPNKSEQPQPNDNSNVSSGEEDAPKKGEGDHHPCLTDISLDEDKGWNMIYNVEPEYKCICSENKVQFFPPVYIQRYMEIDKILKQPLWADNVKKVIDFGCSELSFEMKYLKQLNGIEEIIAVDIDRDLLERNCCKVSTFTSDYLKKRPTPLTVKVFHGSVAHTHDSLIGADAVIAIELIEHLFPPELDCLPFTIFGFVKPKIAVFTTPNADFNVLFKGMKGFRHPDHKFEWSQSEFQDWANNLVERYPDYQVTFQGIGPGPPGSDECGCCSQMATFVKVNESNSISDDDILVQHGPYTLILENEFPFFKDERSEEEKVRDAAEYFINTCKMRSRISDEVTTEIPVKSVMSRIKYYDKEKLKDILVARNWEVTTNSSGEEVVIFPDSEEEDDSEPEFDETMQNNFESVDNSEHTCIPHPEENWDDIEDDGKDMSFLHDTSNDPEWPSEKKNICRDQVVVPNQSYQVVDFVNTVPYFPGGENTKEKLVISDKVNISSSEKCSIPETTVPEFGLSDKLSSCGGNSIPEKDTNLNFEKSIYETPYNSYSSNHCISNCDLCDFSLPSSGKTVKGCKRSLTMESPKELAQFEANAQSKIPFCLSTASSFCDTSIYSTPCCSQRHRNNIPKCLSLQQISSCSGSPALSTELDTTLIDGKFSRNQSESYSKSMEGFKSLENDLTCSSTSRVVDSGYPDSYSEYNMDMDLTPEQFDDIETENDASSRSLSPPPPPPPPLAPQIPWLMDDVQNGDVVNNNRDGEGNNLVADMELEPAEFEARIEQINNEVLNLAPANNAINDFDHDMKLEEQFQEMCGDCLSCISNTPTMVDPTSADSEKSPNNDLSKVKSLFTDKNAIVVSSDSFDKQILRSTKSDTSISTNHSLSLNPSDTHLTCKSKETCYHHNMLSPKFKTHNSLTTVLDGHSKFSNCSLVRPIEVFQVTGIENDSSDSNKMPTGSTEPIQQENISDTHATASSTSTSLQNARQSLLSVYQSAECLTDMRQPPTEQGNTLSFPEWLLNILVTDIEENEAESADSVLSVWDSDSLEDRAGMNYDVPVDTKGGGDPQTETWQ